MNTLDWLLLFLVGAYAVSGYWQGFITGAFSTMGLLLGGLIGIWLVPTVLGERESSLLLSVGALAIVLISASLGQAVMQFLGSRIRNRIKWQPVRSLDAVGGSALSMAAVLTITWALGVAISGSGLPWLSKNVRESKVLSVVNGFMPDVAIEALNDFNDVVGSSFFPRYLEPFAPERIVEVAPPPARIASDPDVIRAEASVLKIRGENDCDRGVEGTGFLYSPTRIMTNAHVVAGVDNPMVIVDDEEVEATVVYYDPDIDVAVLAVPNLGLPHLGFDTGGGSSQPGAVLGYPNDGPYDIQGARIRSEEDLRSPDIYGDGRVTREVFSLRSLVRPGNSGGPLISLDGDVLGVVFAASVTDKHTGYALTASQVARAAAAGLSRSSEVSTQGCA
jgi:S1-C subfamily serine protease